MHFCLNLNVLIYNYFAGHNGPIRSIVHSPNSAAFLTCSDDFRARFWFKKQMNGE